ncbi:hypothetical protein [Gordonia sp. (in: high G+C Gram-positive bacteria)]|jgi:hypothetical protein|uniref:hypothetical protein n=1 Tax=Gordonia sp. (in: high G+C Gram-positive bacteria) TaxID=84139 RepID=UPI001D45FC6D|nr:hypothetical protein [Gordonia sp. (in: high G+C Gram-positive bacteria)]MCB1296927.1 hypothetical protein [Gordonia sp. (in: high G+C Gram-positive bacteria)]HMS77081.1 hypothetical protein [Gordonia sp. (in: high G+C Gram-positive bacteria)]HQV16804.1 hypothetical protein [Gordonia sp. (in: high G+C Gram-positive bacteria)]
MDEHHPAGAGPPQLRRTAGEVFDLIEKQTSGHLTLAAAADAVRAEREVADPSALVDHSDTTSKQGEPIRDGARTSRTGIAMTTAEQLHLAGRASLLTSMLTVKFGALDSDTRRRVAHATGEQVWLWASRLAQDAATLDDIFDS